MDYIRIGYPLRVPDSSSYLTLCVIEKNDSKVFLSKVEWDAWAMASLINSKNISHLNKKARKYLKTFDHNIIPILLEKKVLISASTNIDEALNQILEFNLIRQGIYVHADTTKYIIIGKEAFKISTIQSTIWLNACGKSKVSDAFNVYAKKFDDTDQYSDTEIKKHFVNALKDLVRFELLHLR